jgi:hypothetical protein
MNHYPAPPHDLITYLGMIAIVVVVVPWAAAVFSAGNKPLGRRWLGAWLAAWLALAAISAGLAFSGLLSRTDIRPPILQVLILSTLGGLLWHGLSKRGLVTAQRASMASLVLLQSFRLPLEVLMLHAANTGVMPVEFSMAGYNLDVLTGAGALLVGAVLKLSPRHTGFHHALVWAWNGVGITCLVVIAGLAVATSPNVGYFGKDPEHLALWTLYFPYVWLPVLLVGVAVYGHLIITRKLLQTSHRHQPLSLTHPL